MAVQQDLGESPRVLIVRPSALGDVCRTVPALVTLRAAMPRAHIAWLVNEHYADAVRHHPDLDEVRTFPRHQFGRTLKTGRLVGAAIRWVRNLRSQKYDVAIDLQGLFRSGLITWLSGARRRIGFANGRELSWLAYNRRHKVDTRLHTVDRMLGLLAAAGCEPRHNMRLHLGPDDHRWLDEFLAQGVAADASYACLAPTAQWLCKCWPIGKYIELARKMLETQIAGPRLVLVSAPSERDQVKPLLDALSKWRDRVLFPQTTVGQLLALVSRARVLVCNDSAPLHVAIGFDRPIVSVFGPTDPALVGPYGRPDAVVRPPGHEAPGAVNYRAHRDDQTLISQVSVESVWENLEAQVGGVRR